MINRLFRHIKRCFLLIMRSGIIYGRDVKIDWAVKIYNHKNKLILGDNVYLRGIRKGYQAAMPYPTTILIDVKNAIVKIGSNTRINGAYIHAQKSIHIGDNCVIASGVNIMDSNGHILHSENRTIGRDVPEEIIIGNNVWIGLNAVILKNTEIGDNSVVSAGSIVKGVFPANSLIAGNPATIVRALKLNKIIHL